MLVWAYPMVDAPPVPVSDALAVTVAVMVNWTLLLTAVTRNSALSTAAVMFPPRLAAPEKMTKSPTCTPLAFQFTVMTLDPLVAANVTAEGL